MIKKILRLPVVVARQVVLIFRDLKISLGIPVMKSETEFSYPRGTLKICSSETAEATKTIKLWHKRVEQSLKKREIPLTV